MFKKIPFSNLEEIKNNVLSYFERNQGVFYVDDNLSKFLSIECLAQELKIHNLIDYVDSFAFNYMHPKSTTGIHIDIGPFNRSLVIPIIGYEKSFIKFYKSKNDGLTIRSLHGLPVIKFKEEDCSVVSIIKTDEPYLIDTTVPHSVYNSMSVERITLLVRIKDYND
jgi:hypothetical protein